MESDLRRRVESGLRRAIRIEGEPDPAYRLWDRMALYGVTGCAIAVVDDGEVAWSKGYGAVANGGLPVSTKTLFQAASISKVVNALGVLCLAENKLIDLDVDVNEQLRSWHLKRTDPWPFEAVTPRRLLAHIAGTSTSGFVGYEPGTRIPLVTEILDGAEWTGSEAVRVVSRPGKEYHYSGGGTAILEVLVEDVTGQPYGEALRDLVLEPLGMGASHYCQPVDLTVYPNTALGHTEAGVELPGGGNVLPTLAAAGLWTNVEDLVSLVRGMFALRDAKMAVPVISPYMARAMLTPMPNSPHGLGPEVVGDGRSRRFRHNGTNRGYCSQIEGLLGRDRAVVMMTNSSGGNSLIGETLRAIDEAYGWQLFERRALLPARLEPNSAASLAGTYAGPFGMSAEVIWEGGCLYRSAAYGQTIMVPIDEDRFIDSETGTLMAVERSGERLVIKVLHEGTEILRYTKVP